ncbi:hypothetical protein LCGC14_0805710 [marine sediment metagenome]|uniref:Uncharacterized protein n=1 Tax=marine sediment metagenome TaxID=412755 RepID=A0A0F9Q886_9ZZZZ
MEIRKDYRGNITSGKTTHGLKAAADDETHFSFCGHIRVSPTKIPLANDLWLEDKRKAMARKITCKTCKSINE